MRYVIFGNGRVGGNMNAYLTRLGHQTLVIDRAMVAAQEDKCISRIQNADIVAVAITDSALPTWRDRWIQFCGDTPVIHFSGAASISDMYAFHPLYSFPDNHLSMDVMENIPFACSVGAPSFDEVFPNAPNPHFVLQDEDRAYYHALAVLSGNLAAYLWNQTAPEFEQLAGRTPNEVMGVYLQSLVDRFREAPTNSLTGPVARRDRDTVRANLDALRRNDVLSGLYNAFLKAAWPDYKP